MLVIRDEVPSTMEIAHRLAEAGAPAGQGVLAHRQVAGRGRHGREWVSERGGLWLSVVTRPDAAEGLDALSLRIGLALARFLEEALPGLPRLDLKWPNDLLLAGRKVAGVLVEARWSGDRCLWAVAGVGINLRNPVPCELADRAARLADVVAVPEPEALAEALAATVAAASRGGPLDEGECAAWLLRDALRGHRVATPREGVAEGVTPEGALMVRDDHGILHHCRGGVVALTD